MENKLEKTEFEINIIKKINREDVMELLANMGGDNRELQKFKRLLSDL
jgi:hypothetical protein